MIVLPRHIVLSTTSLTYHTITYHIPFICSVRFGKSKVPYFLSINPFFQPAHHRRTHAHRYKHQFSMHQETHTEKKQQMKFKSVCGCHRGGSRLTLVEPLLWWERFEQEKQKATEQRLDHSRRGQNTELFCEVRRCSGLGRSRLTFGSVQRLSIYCN